MKFAAALLALSSLVSVAADGDISMSVEVDVHCAKVNWSSLSTEAKAFSSLAVQQSFNKVHGDMDGDWTLDSVTWLHAIKNVDLIKNASGAWVEGGTRSTGGGYTGSAHCRLCPPDDDAFLSVITGGAATKAWAAELQAALATSNFAELVGAQQCTIVMKEGTESVADIDPVADGMDLPVQVDVHCGKVKFNQLSVEEKAYSSKILTDTYNAVHEQTDGGDWTISDLRWDHSIKTAQFIMAEGSNQWVKVASPASNSNAKVGGGTRSTGGGYTGSAHCRLCPPDDDSSVVLTQSGAALNAWQSAFTAAMNESPYPVLAAAESCNLQLATRSALSEELEQALPVGDVDLNVQIDVHCNGVNFKRMDFADAAFSGAMLQAAYNEVHEKTDGGDWTLDSISYSGPVSSFQLAVKVRGGSQSSGGGYTGSAHCRLCPPDDDAFMFALGAEVGDSLQAWQSLYTSKLMEDSSHPVFSKVSSCSIKMTTGKAAATA